MTATVVAPTLDSVLKRADAQYARRSGDDPASPEYLAVLAKAARPLLEQGAPAEPGVDLQELARLREESAARGRLLEVRAAEIAELRAAKGDTSLREKLVAAAADVERLNARVTVLLRERAEARADRDTAKGQLRDAGPAPDGALEQLQADNARLADELARTRRDLAAANRTLDEIADEEPAAAHVHHYPVAAPGEEAQPCACGQPYPRSYAVAEFEEIVPDVEPWGDLFGRIRDQVTDAGWTT